MKQMFTMMLVMILASAALTGKEKKGKTLTPKSIDVSKADEGTTLNIALPKSNVIDENAIRSLTVKVKDGVLKGVDPVSGDPASVWDVGPWAENVSTSVTYQGAQRSSQEAKPYTPKFGGLAGPIPATTPAGRMNARVFPQDWRWDVQGKYKIDDETFEEPGSVKMPFSKRIKVDDIKRNIDGVCRGIKLNDDRLKEKINELTKQLHKYVKKGTSDKDKQVAYDMTIQQFRLNLNSQLDKAQKSFEDAKLGVAKKIKNNIDNASPSVKITNTYLYRNDQKDPADADLGWGDTNTIEKFGVKGFDLNGRIGFKSPIQKIKVDLKGDIWLASAHGSTEIDINMSFYVTLGLKGEVIIYHNSLPSPKTSPSAKVTASPKVDITGTATVESKQSMLEADLSATFDFGYDVGALEGTIIADEHRVETE